MEERNSSFDLFRIILCLFVVIIHYISSFSDINSGINVAIVAVLFAANGLFYMLSGYFNLEKEFEDSTDIIEFYKNKVIKLVLPFLVLNLVFVIWDYVSANSSFNILSILSNFYATIFDTGNNSSYMWFLYPLFGLLLSTPFLSKMLHHMDEKELKLLWYICLGFSFICFYLCEDFGVNFNISGWLFAEWAIYYYAGYYYRHVACNDKKLKWLIIGLVGYLFTILGNYGKLSFFKYIAGSVSLQTSFVVFVFALFYFWDHYVKLPDNKASKVIVVISSFTYFIYLLHVPCFDEIVTLLKLTTPNVLTWLITVLGTFVVSFVLAFILKLCLKPLQNLIDKHWNVR